MRESPQPQPREAGADSLPSFHLQQILYCAIGQDNFPFLAKSHDFRVEMVQDVLVGLLQVAVCRLAFLFAPRLEFLWVAREAAAVQQEVP